MRKVLGVLRRHPWLTAMAVLALLGVGVHQGGWNLWAAYHWRAARAAIDQRDLLRARAHLRLCLQVWPHSAATHFLAARTARRADDYEEAAQHLDECERLHGPPQDIEAERAMLRAQQGDLAWVERYLVGQVEQDHPEAPLMLEALTKGYAQTFRVPLALYCTGKWLRLQPDNVDALFWQGLLYERLFSQQSHQQALADFRRVVDIDPEHEGARLHLAEALRRVRRFDEALELFQRLAQDDPGNAAAVLGLARCQSALGRVEEARILLDKLVEARPEDVPTLVERGKLALEMNQAAEAERWLQRAVARAPYERMANFFLAQCLEQRGQHDQAQSYRAKLKQVDADWQRLEEVMRQLVNAPLDTSLRFEAGTLLLRVGEDVQGRRWLMSLLEDVPDHRPTHQALADYYERAGNYARATYHRQQAAHAAGQ